MTLSLNAKKTNKQVTRSTFSKFQNPVHRHKILGKHCLLNLPYIIPQLTTRTFEQQTEVEEGEQLITTLLELLKHYSLI